MKSVINGRENYAIVLIDNKIVYAGTKGKMYPKSCCLCNLSRYQWCYFTYKKDFINAINEHNSNPTIDIDKNRALELLASMVAKEISKNS